MTRKHKALKFKHWSCSNDCKMIRAFHMCQWPKDHLVCSTHGHGAQRTLWEKKPPNTVETTSSCDNSCCFYHFTSDWEFGMTVGTQTAVQISPMWLSNLIPTEMRWTKVKHCCNPMDSLTPPYRRAAYLRMRWLRETSNVLSGLWKYLWNNRDHLVKWEQKKYLFIFHFSR